MTDGVLDPAYEPGDGSRDLTHRDGDWAGLGVVVMGLGVSGFAAADALLERGAQVTVLSTDASEPVKERAHVLEILGAQVLYGPEHQEKVGQGVDLVVTSPGVRPTHPYMLDAAEQGIPVWGEVELAWRMRAEEGAAPWLTITGTNGKTTAVTMLEQMLLAAGLRATAAGNVGLPILEAVLHPQPYDVIAVELSSFQLHWSRSISPHSSCCLNVEPDHIDWHGSFEEYKAAKGRVYENTQVACVYNHDEKITEELVMDADVVEGARAIGFTLGMPHPSMLGIVDDVLADRAFVEDRRTNAAELCQLKDLSADGAPPAPHFVADALAAAALARAFGVPPLAVRDGLRAYRPQPHRTATVATVDGIRYVDDSKATNPPAADAALRAFDHLVWIAGGQLKGASVVDLVKDHGHRMRAAVLLGADRAEIAEALAQHAPGVPVTVLDDTDPGVMVEAVRIAREHAREGDVVLLSPAGASLDMYPSYGARGDAFADAVRGLGA